MGINWKMHDSRDLFPAMYAIFLWNEIEPSEQQLLDPPGPILIKGSSIIKAILSARGPFAGPLDIRKGKEFAELYQPTIKQKLPEEIPSHFANVRRRELVRAAEKLGEKPKFLFPEARQLVFRESSQIVVDKPFGTRERNSYCKFIQGLARKAKRKQDIDEQLQALEGESQKEPYLRLASELLKDLGINPYERAIAKPLQGMVKTTGKKDSQGRDIPSESLDQDTIRKILKKIQQLHENS
jgi:hypothetical protein